MDFKIFFLGTSNAIPTKDRNHTSIFIDLGSEKFLVDCGEGTQRQLRMAEISPTKITKIFLTHLHGDHSLGLPGLLQTLVMSEYQKELEIYGPTGTHKHIENLQHLYGQFQLKIKVKECSGVCFQNKDLIIQAYSMSHNAPTNAYTFTIKEKRRLDKKKLRSLKLPNSPLLGQLQQGKDITWKGKKIKSSSVSYLENGKKLAIILDTRMNAEAVKAAQNADLVITESTFLKDEEKRAQEYAHLTAEQAATIAKKAKAKKLILTHISQRYEHQLSLVEKEARKVFKNTKIAKDFYTITI